MPKQRYTKVERAVFKLIEEAQNHEAYQGQDGTNAQGTGLAWLKFVITHGRLRLELNPDEENG